MRRTIPVAAILFLVASCTQTTRKASVQPIGTGGSVAPSIGLVATVWAVNDKADGSRIGYVEETRYDNGAILYMVRGPDRRTGRGYILPNNVAYRYTYIDGKRSSEHEKLGAQTFASGARQILGYDRPVTLERLSDEQIAAEARAGGSGNAASGNAGSGGSAVTEGSGTGGESASEEDAGESEE